MSGVQCNVTSEDFTQESIQFTDVFSNGGGTFSHQAAMQGNCKCESNCKSECSTTVGSFCVSESSNVFAQYVSSIDTRQAGQAVNYPTAATCMIGAGCAIQECIFAVCGGSVTFTFSGFSASASGSSIVGRHSLEMSYQCDL